MAWRFVQTPDGKFARFSDIVDNFTDYNMTFEEAVELCKAHNKYPTNSIDDIYMTNLFKDELNDREARSKVQRAVNNADTRWAEALDTIRIVHGKTALIKVWLTVGGKRSLAELAEVADITLLDATHFYDNASPVYCTHSNQVTHLKQTVQRVVSCMACGSLKPDEAGHLVIPRLADLYRCISQENITLEYVRNCVEDVTEHRY